MGKTRVLFSSFAILIACAGLARADRPGQLQYEQYCARCHGERGKGDGPALQVIPGFKPSDLTVLSADNGGKFPYDEVYQVIDGRKRVQGHNDWDSDMPLWGLQFQLEGKEFTPESEAKAMRRISDLVDYVQSLQNR